MIPTLNFSPDPAAIADNAAKIKAARAAIKAASAAIDGLHQANVGLCLHPGKVARYDPGYAGGGFSHYECPACEGYVR